MKSLRHTFKALLVLYLLAASCSSDEGDNNTTQFTASDLILTIDEHTTTSLLGTITTNIEGNLNYTISSQSVDGALGIDNFLGHVFVNDRSKIDFETTPVFDATVTVSNSSDSVSAMIQLTLNNVDDIATFLSSNSRAIYDSASPGDWIKISSSEYNILASTLKNVVKSGSTDEQYNFDDTISPVSASANGITMVNNNGVSMPIDSYVFAFKYNVTENNIQGAKVKAFFYSCCPMTDNKNIGEALPMHNSGDNYFVLKGNSAPTSHAGIVGFFCPKKPGFKQLPYETNYLFNQSDAIYFSDQGATESALILYQGLSTTLKQWN
ncbi:hypothetical protein [uncultured Psychroserpens sp.]|uniref:hypothetical protein n=1 Tax=uncultured Psychroserpens sp. TaxID=255436 RepID=UPI00261910CC|nr:hypothetical protein [uncultured Psychroserpens sp.]